MSPPDSAVKISNLGGSLHSMVDRQENEPGSHEMLSLLCSQGLKIR